MEVENIECYLSLGSNLGNRTENLNEAIIQLAKLSDLPIEKSSFHETEPLGFESDNNFLNCCVKLTTSIQPAALLKKLQSIEIEIGRKEKSKNEAYKDRLIDIDIIFYGSLVINSKKLTIPHPQYRHRNFVLIPLMELCPQLIDPSTKTSVEQHYFRSLLK